MLSKKKIYKIVLLLLIAGSDQLAAQKPLETTRPAAQPANIPASYDNNTINYIRTWQPASPITDAAQVSNNARTTMEVRQEIKYFDGLGRPIQLVSKGLSPMGKDVVSTTIYDSLGREQYTYLPYVATDASDGHFKLDPFNRQAAFYQDNGLNPGVTGEQIYYARTEYENSPLNRLLKTYSPGNSWAKEGGNHPQQIQYLTNTTEDDVKIWNLTGSSSIPFAAGGTYSTGELIKNVVIDESGSSVIEYKDREGNLILKKQLLNPAAGNGHAGWLCTYYVYDHQNLLRFVIPPKAVEAIAGNWIISGDIASELCFSYQYDKRKRMIMKQLPGAGPVYMVYDVRDRLVLTQDALQRSKASKEWMMTSYDGLNRQTMIAIYKSDKTREELQAGIDGGTNAGEKISYAFPAKEDLFITDYEGEKEFTARNSITFIENFDSGSESNFIASIDTHGTMGTTTTIVNSGLPGITMNDLTPLTYTFYDNYDFAGKRSYQVADLVRLETNKSPYAEPLPGTPSVMTQGVVTGIKARVLGTDNWLTTTLYYDNKLRLIQNIADNNAGGTDVITNLYDFSGKPLCCYLKHENPKSIPTPKINVLTWNTYDAAGRILTVTRKINDLPEQMVAEYTYDELGKMKRKRLGVTGNDTQLDTVNYDYNIRGWLQGINRSFVNTTGSTSNWFGEQLHYDNGFSENQLNGNIAGIKWKSGGDGVSRAYGYNYDKVSRLINADFSQQDNGAADWTNGNMDFSVSRLQYDANGNILTMSQNGMVGNNSTVIDYLSYTYEDNSNKLLSVSDTSNTRSAKLGDFINSGNNDNDYSYDKNGNLLADSNKAINFIRYNFLNLPDSIAIRDKGSISYQYDASGTRLKKTVVELSGDSLRKTITDYITGFVYKQDTLQFFPHEEGRVRALYKTGTPVDYTYDYFETDHLGNVRLVLGTRTDTSIYTATMEVNAAERENALFSNIDNTRTTLPPGYPADGTINPNTYVAKLNARNGQKIGPSLVLRVMAGDTVKIVTKAFYKSIGANQQNATPSEMLSAILSTFNSGNPENAGHEVVEAMPISNGFTTADYTALKSSDEEQNLSDKPKAYLNYALFDDQFKMVNANSGVKQVQSSPDELQTLSLDGMTIKKNGFLYIYTSNESAEDVFFDNLVVVHNNGPLLEETHYYPFGLTMAGISAGAIKGGKYAPNSKLFNGIEHTTDLDQNQYDALYRNMDPQLGRWWQLDPKPDYSSGLYNVMGNNPVRYMDPLGDTLRGFTAKSAQRLLEIAKNSFSGNSKMQELFKVGTDSKTFNSIDVAAFLRAAQGMDYDQLMLAVAYFVAINDQYNQVVSIFKKEEGLEDGIAEITNNTNVSTFEQGTGGGENQIYEEKGENATITLILMDRTDGGPSDWVTGTKKVGSLTVDVTKQFLTPLGALVAHELLGHGTGRMYGSDYHDGRDAIQMTNLYMRSQKSPLYRNGLDHGSGKIQYFDKKEANGIPEVYENWYKILRLINYFIK